jgi:hypothetical protein
MTNDEIIGLFLRSLDLLPIRGDCVQLDPPLTYKDLNTITSMCFSVETIAKAGDTPADMALHRLSFCTAAVLTTAAIDGPDNAVIVAEWRSARAEYEQLSN